MSKIPNLGLLVINQTDGRDFFISAENSLVISVASLSFIMRFLVENNFISPKVLEGILEDYNTDRGKDET